MNTTDRRTAHKNLAAAAADKTAPVWLVRGGYAAGSTNNVLQSHLTFRQACAVAKALRAGCAYAKAERA